ncbi:MAG TPA: AMP-binding protein [Mycobacterium sp.]|nr:AMP-binding protein [Mycobacterium sp.]
MPASSILALLHGRASLRPHDVAFTFVDHQKAWEGVPESLTWSKLSRRTLNMAREISLHGSVGDRAAILAPQGLDYIVAFLGAVQAGLIAVPLPLPNRGASDERVGTVLADTSPSVVLTTSAVAADVGGYVDQSRMDTVPKIIEVDRLQLDDEGGTGVAAADLPAIAYLQYSSGSTRQPTGAMMTHRNLAVNFEQLMGGIFANSKVPADTTIVSWLPFYHDMGLFIGVCVPILGGYRAELTSPASFVERPARWMRSLAANPHTWSAAPNFAFELAARKTTDSDLAGLDLGGVLNIINGAERVEPSTLQRFADRFAHFNFADHMLRPSYGLAEATLFVTTSTWSEASPAARFDTAELSAGRVRRCADRTGTALVEYEVPQSPALRIVDSDTRRECPPDFVGEIWVHGDNVALGYWGKTADKQSCFGATLVDPSPGTPDGSWLKTGDLGFVSDGKLFIVGRIKDLLIIRGRNHYPEDIEATVREITGGRVAAIALPVDSTEELVTIAEVKGREVSGQDSASWLDGVKTDVTSAIANAHGLHVGDLVLVSPGSIPITTSGKIRRAACVERYRQDRFARLDG